MDTIEMINANREKIINALKTAERESYLHTECEYRVYIDSKGECGDEEWIANDNGWFEFRDGYSRAYIHTFCSQHYSVLWDWWFVDPNVALSEFRDRFGFDVEQGDDSDLASDMRNAAIAHGVSESEYEKWIDEQTETAISELTENNESDGVYDSCIDEAIEDIRRGLEWA